MIFFGVGAQKAATARNPRAQEKEEHMIVLLTLEARCRAMAEKRVALVIGESGYQKVLPLTNPARDRRDGDVVPQRRLQAARRLPRRLRAAS